MSVTITQQVLSESEHAITYAVTVNSVFVFEYTKGKGLSQVVTWDELLESLQDDIQYLDDWQAFDDLGYTPSQAHDINERIRANTDKLYQVLATLHTAKG